MWRRGYRKMKFLRSYLLNWRTPKSTIADEARTKKSTFTALGQSSMLIMSSWGLQIGISPFRRTPVGAWRLLCMPAFQQPSRSTVVIEAGQALYARAKTGWSWSAGDFSSLPWKVPVWYEPGSDISFGRDQYLSCWLWYISKQHKLYQMLKNNRQFRRKDLSDAES